MRILFVTNTWSTAEQPWRGVLVERQRTGLRRAGVEVDVLPIHGYANRFEYARAAAAVAALNFAPRRYDVVHAHTGHCGVVALFQIRYPIVMSYVGYDIDGIWEGRETLRTKLATGVFRQLSRVLAATIAKSERGRERLPAAGIARNHLLPNGVDLDEFRPLPRTEARRRLGWNHDRPVVFFPSDPKRYTKRFELADAAVARARVTHPDLQLLTAEGVMPDEMRLRMNAADVLILTSRTEGSPNTVKEAMACDLPVVSVDVGDVAQVVGGTRHCHVCPADPDALAAALTAVVAALPERSDGRRRISYLSLEATTQRLLEVYAQARGRGPGGFGFLRVRPRRSGGAQPNPAAQGAISNAVSRAKR